jgi:hypothetical protein
MLFDNETSSLRTDRNLILRTVLAAPVTISVVVADEMDKFAAEPGAAVPPE